MSEPCEWPAVTRCGCAAEGCWTSRSPATRERASTLAAHFLWAATGRRYGPCEVVVQPCNPAPVEALYQEYGLHGPSGFDPYILNGAWHNAGCAGGSCEIGCAVELPGPVASIVEVLVDCLPVSPDAYLVVNSHLLVRVDGQCWPANNAVAECPGLEVTYNQGTPIPDAIQFAYEGLACQVAKACDGAADCALPPRMRSLTRQGVSIEVATEEATSQGGKLRTGIKWIDDTIDADNPGGLTQPPMVLSLDQPPVRTVTSVSGS